MNHGASLILGIIVTAQFAAVPAFAQDTRVADPAVAPAAGIADAADPVSEILPSVPLIGGDGCVDRRNLNPIVKGYCTLRGAVGSLLAFVLSFVGVLALLFLVLQGFRYITGYGGGPEQAKRGIANVILGIILIIGAWAIVVTVLTLGGGPGV